MRAIASKLRQAFFLLLLCACVLAPKAHARVYPVYVGGSEIGQGSVFREEDLCLVMVPKHVIKTGERPPLIGDEGQQIAYTVLYLSPTRDFLLLRTTLPPSQCPQPADGDFIDHMLDIGAVRFFLRQANGDLVQHSYIVSTSSSTEFFAQAAEKGQGLSQGMSGGVLTLEGAPIGIAVSERAEDGRITGRFLRIDSALAEARGILSLTADDSMSQNGPMRQVSGATGRARYSGYAWPSTGPIIEDFGSLLSDHPTAIQFALERDAVVHPIADGVVEAIDVRDGKTLITVRHDEQLVSRYRACLEPSVRVGSRIRGRAALFSDASATCRPRDGLFLEISSSGAVIDPLSILGPRVGRLLTADNQDAAGQGLRVEIQNLARSAEIEGRFDGALTVRESELQTLRQKATGAYRERYSDAFSGDVSDVIAKLFENTVDEFRGQLPNQDSIDVWTMRPSREDVFRRFLSIIQEKGLAAWISDWEVQLEGSYVGEAGLKQALPRYLNLAAAGGWPSLTATSSANDIRHRLVTENPNMRCEGIEECIQMAQRRYGLNPTGQLDAATLAALNVTVEARIASIVGNIERWRWTPDAFPPLRMQINSSAGVATIFEDDQPVISLRASIGTREQPQPIFASYISSIDVRATSISSVADKSAMGPANAEMQVTETSTLFQIGSFVVEDIREIRFNFPNSFNQKMSWAAAQASLFERYDRPSLDGNILLDKGISLLDYFVSQDNSRGGGLVAQVNADGTLHVELAKPIAVYGFYWTAFAAADGSISFREDPNGWDVVMASSLSSVK